MDKDISRLTILVNKVISLLEVGFDVGIWDILNLDDKMTFNILLGVLRVTGLRKGHDRFNIIV